MMWIKDIRNYEIEVSQNGNVIYKGNSDNAPQELKDMQTKSVKIGHKKLDIEV